MAGILPEQQSRGLRANTGQLEWLKAELAAEGSSCSVAYFHHPRFSSGSHGLVPPPPVVNDIWRQLYDAGTDIVISAHEHFYERFAPQMPEGQPDPVYGIRQFVVEQAARR